MKCSCPDGEIDLTNVDAKLVRHLCDLSDDPESIIVPFKQDQMREFNRICGEFESVPIDSLLEHISTIDFCSEDLYEKTVAKVCSKTSTNALELTKDQIEKIFKMHSIPRDIDHIFRALFSLSSNMQEFFDITKNIRTDSRSTLEFIDFVSKMYPPGIVASHFLSHYGNDDQIRDIFDEFIDQFDEFLRRNLLTSYDIDCLIAFSEKFNCPERTLEHLRVLADSLCVPYSYVHKRVDDFHLGIVQVVAYREKITIQSPLGTIFFKFDAGLSGHVTLKRKFKGKIHINFVVSELHHVETVVIGEKTCRFSRPLEFVPDFIYIYSDGTN